MLKLIEKENLEKWEIQHSSLAKIMNHVTYDKCRKYACEDISNRTISQIHEKNFVLEIPEGKEFHFIGRVNTSLEGNHPNSYYETFRRRNFVSFSTINKRNISHYKGGVFFVYNILPDDIVHIFPLDSDTKKMAITEEELSIVPSLWLTLEELEYLTEKMKVYNQITCKTRRKGIIIKPYAVIAFNNIDSKIQTIANEFDIGCIIVHPDKDAINYDKDLLYDCTQLNSISYIMEKEYGLNVKCLEYLD